jgi:uncharacterized damage-inducible protein DinB
MITDIASFLRYFEGVNKRALRDIGNLPAEAEGWRPQSGDGENAWSIGELVGHMAASRMFFVRAYCGDGWTPEPWPNPTTSRPEWVAALAESAALLDERLGETPDDWLHRRIESMDTPGMTFSGWRGLMMMTEHDVHHRSQIDTYAGIAGWPVQQIFGRTAEQVGLQPRRSQ